MKPCLWGLHRCDKRKGCPNALVINNRQDERLARHVALDGSGDLASRFSIGLDSKHSSRSSPIGKLITYLYPIY